MSMMQEKMYMDVDDVCAILGVSKTYAYSLMREYNKELKAKGYIVVAGKISTKFSQLLINVHVTWKQFHLRIKCHSIF